MGVYNSSATANTANVQFDFVLALQAARDLYQLHCAVEQCQSTRSSAAGLARPDWSGRNRDLFDQKMAAEAGDAGNVSGGLVALANLFARTWAEARGQQDRINTARYVQHKQDSENWAQKGVDDIIGQPDYGAPPGDPPVPSPPSYQPTRAPMHPEFQDRG